jgi:hypothetical protein
MSRNITQQSFQDSTLTLGKGEVMSSILIMGFFESKNIDIRVFWRFVEMPFCFGHSQLRLFCWKLVIDTRYHSMKFPLLNGLTD